MAKQSRLDVANNARIAQKEAMQLWVLELILNSKTVKEIEMITNYSKSRIYDAIKIFDEEFVTNAYTNHFNNKVTFYQYQTFLKLNCNYKQYKKQYGKKQIVISEWGEEIEDVPQEPTIKVDTSDTDDWYFKMKEKKARANLLMKLKDIIKYDSLMSSRQNFATKLVDGVGKYNFEGELLTIEEVKKLHDDLVGIE